MSAKHLQTGDSKPAFDNSKKFRIYSMKFCPFAERARLVAAAKGLSDFDVVNIKLRGDLPEWYLAINPLRKVPAIEFPNGDVIYESLIVSDLLDELYPETSLHSKNPKEKAKQRLFLDGFGNTNIPAYYKHVNQPTDETKQEFLKGLQKAEQYLAENKIKYFGGEKVGMLDYMVWPWFERIPMIHTLSADQHPKLTRWFNNMQDEPAVKQIAISKENHKKFYDLYKTGQPNYDFL